MLVHQLQQRFQLRRRQIVESAFHYTSLLMLGGIVETRNTQKSGSMMFLFANNEARFLNIKAPAERRGSQAGSQVLALERFTWSGQR